MRLAGMVIAWRRGAVTLFLAAHRLLRDRPILGYAAAFLIVSLRLGQWLGPILSMAHSTSGTDLRNRIVGARALGLGLDPYDQATIDQGGTPVPALADPEVALAGFSRTTAPPTVLDFYSVFIHGDWLVIRLFWGSLEWLALLGVGFAFIRATRPTGRRGLMALILALFVVNEYFWYLHVYVSEYYIYVAALIAGDVILLSAGASRFAGLMSGLAIALRPPLLLMAPILLAAGQRGAAWRAGLVGAALLGASLSLQPRLWESYSHLIERHIVFVNAGAVMPADQVDHDRYNALRAAAAIDGYNFEQKAIDSAQTPLINFVHENIYRPLLEISRLLYQNWKLTAAIIGTLILIVGCFVARICRRAGLEATLILIGWLPSLIDFTAPLQNPYNALFQLPGIGVITLYALRNRRLGPLALFGIIAVGAAFGWKSGPEPFFYQFCMGFALWTALRADRPPVTAYVAPASSAG